MGRKAPASLCAGALMALASVSVASEPPRVYLQSRVLSAGVVAFDMKVVVASEEPWQAGFAIGIHWDPAVLDLVDVNLEGTVFSQPGVQAPMLFVNLKLDGRPSAGIFAPFLTIAPIMAPPGPFLNLHFVRVGDYFGPTETVVRLGPFPCVKGAPCWPEMPSVILWRGQSVEVAPERGHVAFVSGVPFRRGDVNGDLASDLSDAIAALSFLFQGTKAPSCLEAADVNADGALDISDGIYLLNFLFAGGAEPPEPFRECGPVAEEALGCERYGPCA